MRHHLKELGFLLGLSGLFRKIAFGLVVVLASMAVTHAQQKEPTPPEAYRYEDWYTFKTGKTYTLDPYTWVYTRGFAELFRMPKKWIDENLKGALAVAFRMTTIGNVTCGLAGREDNCWPPLECQMDVYYDNRVKMPWMREEIVRDFLMRGIASNEFLYDLNDSKGIRRYLRKDAKGIPKVLASGGVIKVGKFQNLSARVAYFDREYQPGIGMIGWVGVGVCPRPIGIGHMYFYDLETSEKISHMQVKLEDVKPMHVIEFPESFMRRANSAYERDNKPSNEVTERLLKQFFESRQPSPKPQ